MTRIAVLMTLAVAATVASAGEHDWPTFRGSEGNGISKETGLLDKWPEAGPKVVWRRTLGEGFSGISVVDDRIYTAYARQKLDYAACLDATTGKEIWSVAMGNKFLDDQGGPGPRSTPVIENGVGYFLSSQGNLLALDTASGKKLWSRDLVSELGAGIPKWGISTTPLIEGNLLLVDVGGKPGKSLVAFDKKSGETIWTSHTDIAGYSTPIAITVGGVRQIIFFTGSRMISVSPKDGGIYWEVPWKTSYDVNAAVPVFVAPDRIFVSSGYDHGAAMMRVIAGDGEAKVEELWKTRAMKNQFSTSVLIDDHLYGFDDKTLKCIDVKSGATLWRKRGFGHGSLVYADGHLTVLGDRGKLALVEATAKEYRQKGVVEILEGKCWTVPTISNGQLFIRNETEILALNVKE